jgi:small-conductance mechanosensitive channel
MGIIRVLVSVALFALAIVVILDNLGVNVTALVAGLGIGGIAIGLAAQGIFSDLFAALAILFDKPFRKGDTIRFDQTVGRVERIGLKTTRMRSLSGEQVIMANTKLLEREIHNLADGRLRRITIPFGVRYETPLEKLTRMDEIANEAVESVPGCKPVRCTLANFGASGLDYHLLLDVKSIDPDKLARDRAAVMLALIERFAKEDIAFAYPVQIAYTAGPDGELVMPYAGD